MHVNSYSKVHLESYDEYYAFIDNIKDVYGFKYHHTSSRRGYVSRKLIGVIEPYEGKFGKGYIIARPRWDTNQYCDIEYYIESK